MWGVVCDFVRHRRGISSALRHWQLAELFGGRNLATLNITSSAGASLYAQLLQDTLEVSPCLA